MIKILHYLKGLELGGTEKSVELFAKHLSKDEFDVRVAFDCTKAQFRLPNFKSNQLLPYSTQQEFLSIEKSFKPDIIHVHRAGHVEFPSPWQVSAPKFVETNVFGIVNNDPQIDKTLFMSEWLLNYARNQYNTFWQMYPSRFDFVNNPVELPTYREFYDLKGDNPIILGRSGRPDNGVYCQLSVKAARILLDRGYNILFLVLACPPSMKKDLEKLKIPHLCLEPTVDSDLLSKFYNTVDIYCESRPDGHTCGNVILESMIHKVPVVTHIAVPASLNMGVFQAQSYWVQNFSTGFCTNANEYDYAQHIEILINDKVLYKKCAINAYNKVLREASINVSCNKLQNIYRQVLNG